MIHHLAASTASTDPLLPSWPEFIIGTILFILVFGAFAKLLLPRIQPILAERTEKIEGGLQRSEEAQKEAQELLAVRWGVSADTYAVTSWSRLRTDALEVERWNRLHPGGDPRRPLVTEVLGAGPAPVVAITDYMRSVPD